MSKEDQTDEIKKKIDKVDKALSEVEPFMAKAEEVLDEQAEKPYDPGLDKDSVHLLLHKGKRFDPETGERISEQFVQKLTYSEWLNFKVHYKSLGYTIDKVLYNPFND